jgi:hypothetical protein
VPNIVVVSPHRTFRGDDDREWTAWDVVPTWVERRVADRRSSANADGSPRDRRLADRRHVRGIRVTLAPNLMKGWVAFESDDARRRLAPIPENWHLLSDDQLRELWRDAEQMPKRRRRLVE